MTVTEIQKRVEKAQTLVCYRLKDGTHLVSSSDGKILYPVSINGTVSCTCADFQRNTKAGDASFRCKHILAALDCGDNADQAETADKKKVRVNPEFIMNLQGKDFIKYNGLLDLAHQKGLIKMDVEIVQYPTTENGNEAVCRAIAETKYGERFTDIGDASPKNCNKMIGLHIIRMASTRSKARALRDLCNTGMTCVEELSELEDVIGSEKGNGVKTTKPIKKEPAPKSPAVPTPAKQKETVITPIAAPKPKTESAPKADSISKPKEPIQKLSEAQKRAMYNVGRRRGISQQELEDTVKKSFGVPVDELSQAQASQMIRQLQTAA